MTDTKPTLEEQIETLQRIIGRTTGIQAFVNPDILTDILASLKELQSIKSQPVPVEPDYWNKLAKEHYWENEAKRYAVNAEYWRERAEKAEAENERLVELVEHAKTQFQEYLNGPCTFTKSRTSTDCGCVSCTTRNAMNELLREVGK